MDHDLISIKESAHRLSVSTSTMRRWIAQGRLPYVRLGRILRIRTADLSALVRIGLSSKMDRKLYRQGTGREKGGRGGYEPGEIL